MIGRLIRRLLLAALALAAFAGGLTYLLGPHAEVAETFKRYRAAHIAGDRAAVGKLTAPAEIAFIDAQRKLALTAQRSELELLGFREKTTVLRLRQMVRNGDVPMKLLATGTASEVFLATMPIAETAKTLQNVSVLFAVPTGANTAKGYLRLSSVEGLPGQHLAMAIMLNASYDFIRDDKGEWQVDPTPILEGSAKENEYWATQLDPTGNTYITKALLQAYDPAEVAMLWQPLRK